MEEIWESKANLQIYLQDVVRIVSEQTEVNEEKAKYRYRNVWNMKGLQEVRDYISQEFEDIGYAQVTKRSFVAKFGQCKKCAKSETVQNLIVELKGSETPEEIIIIGAHYDSRVTMKQDPEDFLSGQRARIPDEGNASSTNKHWNTPGANDNGSGIAALLALASALKNTKTKRTIRFVAWVNEEFPFYANRFDSIWKSNKYYASGFGSYVHAKDCSDMKENIVAAISLDTMGCYPGDTYHYQPWSWLEKIVLKSHKLPEKGDYVAFLSNAPSKNLVKKFAESFADKTNSPPPSIHRSLPWLLNCLANWQGAWSDDWSFWKKGYPGFIITDMAYIRSHNYHSKNDTIENMNFPEFTEVVWRLRSVLQLFANKKL